MGAHDSTEQVPSVADYLSAGEIQPLLSFLTFDESQAFDTPVGRVLIGRVGRTSVRATWGSPMGEPDTIALHVHDSIEGATECHAGTVDQVINLFSGTGGVMIV